MKASALALAAALLAGGAAARPELPSLGLGGPETGCAFRPDDPVLVDRDDLPGPVPEPSRVNDVYDVLEMSFFPPWDPRRPRALDVNTLDELPDSSWFTNRIGTRELSLADLVRGPDRTDGPAPGTWRVVGAKSEGRTPGFRIEDARGDRYLVKFDPPSNPELATSVEVIGTKLFWALGYHVPENHVVELDPARLVPDPEATVTDAFGRKRPLTADMVGDLLATVARRSDGRIRALASRFLEGKPVGPFEFSGTRPDDVNDVIPHEHRRVLRAYRVFAAWLNHDDSRSINTLDTYLGEPGQGHVRHHLIDFGSILGSASIRVQDPRGGNEYFFEWEPTLRSLWTLGAWVRPWARVPYREYRAVGRIEAEFFDPEAWKPEYPNMAFLHMDRADAFWGAKLVMRFSDEDLRAVVRAGRISDPEAEAYLARVLARRRDKIGDAWLRGVLPLDGFRLDGRRLAFEDLLVRYGFEPRSEPLRATFAALDNATGERTPLFPGPTAVDAARGVELPREIAEAAAGTYHVVTLAGAVHRTDVFLRAGPDGPEIAGIWRW